jgi:hypothetical protein
VPGGHPRGLVVFSQACKNSHALFAIPGIPSFPHFLKPDNCLENLETLIDDSLFVGIETAS